jgi:hypothetical protein
MKRLLVILLVIAVSQVSWPGVPAEGSEGFDKDESNKRPF